MSRQLLTFGGQFLRARGNPLAAYAAGGINPATVLDFSLDKYLGTVEALDDLTFARASNATYIDANGILQTAAANVPRFDYTTGARRLLIEPTAATNITTYSNDLSQWDISNTDSVTVTAGQGTGPDGNASLSFLEITDTTSEDHGISDNVVTSSTQYTFAGYLKDVDQRYVALKFVTTTTAWTTAVFDLQTGTVTHTEEGSGGIFPLLNAEIVDYGSGLYRVSLSVTHSGVSVALYWSVDFCSSGTPTLSGFGRESYAGAAGVGFYAGHFDITKQPVPTSYIPTNGATATRAAETITFDMDAGTYDVRIVTEDGTTDLTSVVHGGGAYWPTEAAGRIAQVIVYPEGALA